MTRAALLVVLLAFACRREEPLYDGEPMGYWVREAKQVSFFSFWNSTKDERRNNAFRRLSAIGEPAVPALLKLFREERVPVSGDAFNALANLGPRAASAVPDLIEIVKGHENLNKRSQAVWILGTIGPAAEPAVAFITPMLRDPNPRVRDVAARALGAIGGTGHLVLQRGQESRDATMRRTAMRGVAARDLQPPERQEHIARALSDPSPDVRLTGVDLLRLAPREEVEGLSNLLVKALNDTDARVVSEARRVVTGYSQHQVATPTVMAAVLNGGEPESQAAAAWWLGSSYRHPLGPAFRPGDTFIIQALLDALKAPTPTVRIYAARALALGEGEVRTRGIEALRRELPGAEPILAVRAARVLWRVSPDLAEVRQVYVRGLQDAEQWNRVETLGAMLELGTHAELFRDEYERLLNDPSPEVRERAAKALHRIEIRR
jgi:HEAT repeat protein